MNEINFSRLRSLTAQRMVRALRRDGFRPRRQKGSHQHYYHEDGRRVTVAYSRLGDTFSIEILRHMIVDQAGWTMDDLRRLRLL